MKNRPILKINPREFQDISSGFLNTSTPTLQKVASKLADIPKIAIFNNIDVKELVIWDTYHGCGCGT